MNIGNTILIERRKRGYTQKELADIVGISTPTLSKIERNDGDPKMKTLYALMSALGLTVDIQVIDPESEQGNETIQYS